MGHLHIPIPFGISCHLFKLPEPALLRPLLGQLIFIVSMTHPGKGNLSCLTVSMRLTCGHVHGAFS